jgi:hypothetical protein
VSCTEITKLHTTKKAGPLKSEPAFHTYTPTHHQTKKPKSKKSCGLRVAFLKTIKLTNTDIHPHPTTIYPTSPD